MRSRKLIHSHITFKTCVSSTTHKTSAHTQLPTLLIMDAEEKKPPSVDTSGLGLDNSDASEITFQSAKRGLSIEEIEQSNTAHIGGTTARRLTDPRSQTYQPSNNHIDTIIKLKLQVAQQKEMIDSLTLDLNNALSEKKAILSKAVSLTLDLNHEFSEKNKAILSKAKKPIA